MSTNSDGGSDGRSLPDAIAAEAGMPRPGTVSEAPHASSAYSSPPTGSAHGTANTKAHDMTSGSTVETQKTTAETAARDAANTAASLKERATAAAQDAGDRLGAGYKQAKEAAADALDDASGRATRTYNDAKSWASDKYGEHSARAADLADRGARTVKRHRTTTEQFVSENPLLVGVVGVAAGLLLGALLPRTVREDEAIGPYADDLRDQGLRYARDMTHRGRAFVEQALDPDNLDAAVRRANAPQGSGPR